MTKITVRVGCDQNGMGGTAYPCDTHQEVGTLSLQHGWHHGYCGRVVVLCHGTAYDLGSYLLATGQAAILGDHWVRLAAEGRAELAALRG